MVNAFPHAEPLDVIMQWVKHYHTINVIWFYSYKLIDIYQNIARRKNEMAIASDKFNAIFENT